MHLMPRLALPALAMLLATVADAATFVVTRLDDPVADACVPGDCSLREAVAAANLAAGADTISLPAGTLSFDGGEIAVSDDVTIQGTGLAMTTLHNTLPVLLHVEAGTLVFSDATIDGPPIELRTPSALRIDADVSGSLPLAIAGDADAGIRLRRAQLPLTAGMVLLAGGSDSSLEVTDSLVDVLQFSAGDGEVTIAGSTLSLLSIGSGDVNLDLRRSRVRGDTEPPVGGGIGMQTTGVVRIADTEFDGALQGILVQGSAPALLDIQRIDVHGDSGPLYVLTPATLTLADSTFRDNTPGFGRPGAVHLSLGAQATIRGCTFSNNKGDGDTGGALLLAAGAAAAITNSTFSNNSFTVSAAGLGARGAAIGVLGTVGTTSLRLEHVTIVAPSFMPDGIEGSAIGVRAAPGDYDIEVRNTLLRGTCRFQGVGGGLDVAVGNIESPGDGCGLDAANNRVDVPIADLALGALADNGGRTRTHLPGQGSAALGAAEATACLVDDQRGYERPLADGCDVGAVERDGIDVIFADGFES